MTIIITADAVVHRCHHHQQENKNIINIEICISIMFYHVLRSPLPWRKSQVLGPQSNRIIIAKGDHVSWLTRLPGISGEKQPPSERRCLDWFPFVVIWFVWIVIIVIKHFAENYRFWVASCKVENGTGLWTLQFCDTSQTSQHQMHQTHPTCEHVLFEVLILISSYSMSITVGEMVCRRWSESVAYWFGIWSVKAVATALQLHGLHLDFLPPGADRSLFNKDPDPCSTEIPCDPQTKTHFARSCKHWVAALTDEMSRQGLQS